MRNRAAAARSPPPARMAGLPINNAASRQRERGTGAVTRTASGVSGTREAASLFDQPQQGRRRWLCGDRGSCGLPVGASSGNIASHNAFSSESEIRLIFIRSSRIATDTNWAVSRLALSRRPARHCSSVARIECNRCSELATSVSSVTELAR